MVHIAWESLKIPIQLLFWEVCDLSLSLLKNKLQKHRSRLSCMHIARNRAFSSVCHHVLVVITLAYMVVSHAFFIELLQEFLSAIPL